MNSTSKYLNRVNLLATPTQIRCRKGTERLLYLMRYIKLLLLMGVFSIMLYIGDMYIKISKFNKMAARMHATLGALDRTPSGISPSSWERAVGCTLTACSNICYSSTHINHKEMKHFCDDLEMKVNEKISPETLEWIWNRLLQTGPWGRAYVEGYKNNFDDILKKIHLQQRESGTKGSGQVRTIRTSDPDHPTAAGWLGPMAPVRGVRERDLRPWPHHRRWREPDSEARRLLASEAVKELNGCAPNVRILFL